MLHCKLQSIAKRQKVHPLPKQAGANTGSFRANRSGMHDVATLIIPMPRKAPCAATMGKKHAFVIRFSQEYLDHSHCGDLHGFVPNHGSRR
jgi:hypothetical protein